MATGGLKRPSIRYPTLLGFGLLPAVLAPAGAQVELPARPAVEVRAEAVAGSIAAGQLAVGVQLPSGTYFRLAVLAGAGAAWKDGERLGSARLETQARFHLDPYREFPLGAYGLGGVAATWDSFARWEPRLVLGIGLELPSSGRAGWAVEAALAGGLRFSAVLRGVNPDRR